MTDQELETIRNLIEARVNELEEILAEDTEETKPVTPDVAIGRLSRLDSMQMQQMALEQKRRQQTELQKLKDALKRIKAGSYGVCVMCQQPIAVARLKAQPESIFCIQCAA